MDRSMTGNIGKGSLYRFIGMAFDAVAGMSGGRIHGDAEGLLARLYLHRMASVFGLGYEEASNAHRLDEVVARLDEFHRWKGDDVLPIKLDKIEVKDDREHPVDDDLPDDLFGGRRFDQEGYLGIEAFATYLPIHFFPEESWRENKPGWGIYISEAGVRHVAEIIKQGFHREYGRPPADDEASFLRIAFEVLLRHEMEHFKVESFALSAEMQQRKPLYVPYLMNVYAQTYESDFCIVESLANATVLDSTVIKELVYTLYPSKPGGWRSLLARSLFDRQRFAYSNYGFDRPWHRETDEGRRKLVTYSGRPRRDAMNYLCNQIVTGHEVPNDDLLPFYAFPPDNFFLRAESLVPIYIVKDLTEDLSFIHFSTPKRRDWESFLRQVGFRQTTKGKGDHVVWERPGFRMITNNYFGKELDPNSFKSALQTLGISRRDFDRASPSKNAPEWLRTKVEDAALQPLLA